jgi:CheY-like chemotaxis protein
MKDIEALRDVPVVFLTGHAELARIAAGFSVGGHAYLTKPVDLELLDDEVRAAVGPA